MDVLEVLYITFSYQPLHILTKEILQYYMSVVPRVHAVKLYVTSYFYKLYYTKLQKVEVH